MANLSAEQKIDMSLDQILNAGERLHPGGVIGEERGIEDDKRRYPGVDRHLAGMSVTDIAKAPAEEKILKVGGGTESKSLAGAIAHVARVGDPPLIFALGAGNINTAVKGVAIATKYLVEDGITIVLRPRFRQADDPETYGTERASAKTISLRVHKGSAQTTESNREKVILTVSSQSRAGAVAGAIAGKLRDGLRPIIKAVGATCVEVGIRALAIAGEYLEEDEDPKMLCTVPIMANEPSGPQIAGEPPSTRTVMNLHVFEIKMEDDVVIIV